MIILLVFVLLAPVCAHALTVSSFRQAAEVYMAVRRHMKPVKVFVASVDNRKTSACAIVCGAFQHIATGDVIPACLTVCKRGDDWLVSEPVWRVSSNGVVDPLYRVSKGIWGYKKLAPRECARINEIESKYAIVMPGPPTKEVVTIWLDPTDPVSTAIFRKLYSHRNTLSVRVVLTPVFGRQSLYKTVALLCAEDVFGPSLVSDYLTNGVKAVEDKLKSSLCNLKGKVNEMALLPTVPFATGLFKAIPVVHPAGQCTVYYGDVPLKMLTHSQ